MKVFLIVIFVFCTTNTNAGVKEEQEEEELFEDAVQEFLLERQVPLIMLRTPKSYTIPILVNKQYGNTVYAKKAYSRTVYLCPIDNEEVVKDFKEMSEKNSSSDSSDEINIQNCFIDTKSKNPEQVCTIEVEPYLRKVVENKKPKKCGKSFWGELYQFEYLICKPIKSLGIISKWFLLKKSKNQGKVLSTKRIKMYEFCYDSYHSKILYTAFTMRSPKLLENSKLDLMGIFASYESNTLSTDGYNILENDFELIAKNFKKTLANGMNHKYVLHKLVPPESMAFGHWKKTTYHYANVSLMPKEVSSVWNFIDKRIRQIAIKFGSEFEIYMGEFDTAGNEEKYWCKIVRTNTKSVIIIVRSKEHDSSDLKGLLTGCDQTKCEFEKWPGNEEVDTSLARCCIVQEKHRLLFGLERPKLVGLGKDKADKSENYFDLNNTSWL